MMDMIRMLLLHNVKVIVAMLLICFLYPIASASQSQEKIYSHLILNLSRGIVWPNSVDAEKFVIGVLEYAPLASELSAAATTIKIGSRKVEVRELLNVDDVVGCNVLFIPAYKAKALTGALTKLGSKPTLIITNKLDLAKKGSGVNFLLVDGKLKYEINCKSIEERGMKISASIKGMGIVVN
jgi:hypothetical protein